MIKFIAAALSTIVLAACTHSPEVGNLERKGLVAPGAPGAQPVWAYSGKTGIGTSYEAYRNADGDENPRTGEVSKVWFSLAQGIVTEVMYGLIHQAQIKDSQVLIVGKDFVDSEQADMISEISYLLTDQHGRPLSPAYRIINRDKEGKYRLEKHIFTDPDQQSLLVRYSFTAFEDGLRPVLTVNPHMDNDGVGDRAWISEQGLHAEDAGTYLSVAASDSFEKSSVGFVGQSDVAVDLKDFTMDESYQTTGDVRGNVSLAGAMSELPVNKTISIDVVYAFGRTVEQSNRSAQRTLQTGYQEVLANYNGVGESIGWQDYLASLPALNRVSEFSKDQGHLAYSSALVLKIQEDKTHAGALIASLSNPWGETASAAEKASGYKAVWPRDFYQCAMAFLALGDTETAKVAFEYLDSFQVDNNTPDNKGVGGWFLQKTLVDGQLEWTSVQLDQVAMPIMLGWQLWKNKVFTDQEIASWYQKMLKPAADFLTNGGDVNLDWNRTKLVPPWTQQERWEEQPGFSPSTMASIIAGLVTAAEIAQQVGDEESMSNYLKVADEYETSIEAFTFTTQGKLNHNGRYFLRISENQNPNDNQTLLDRNGKGELNEMEIIDAGFLELVRYGVRSANDSYIVDSLEELDDQALPDRLRVKYDFTFSDDGNSYPGWRRYGEDGYGEDITNGANYGAGGTHGGVGGGMSADQRGRVWPFLTGERAHYELAAGTSLDELRNIYVKGLEHFANSGLMLPEQVFDGVGKTTDQLNQIGEGTNSATPLSWAHAEYIKLLRSLADQKVWDSYAPVSKRYISK